MLKFNIAGLSIIINTDRDYALPTAYRGFYDSISGVSDSIDFTLDVFSSKKAPCRSKDIKGLFNSGGSWRLYRDKNNSYIVVSDSRKLIIDNSISHAELYVKSQHSKQRELLPFSYPLDEILMINLLCRGRGLLVHACGLSYKGKGILFIGSSGAGKSTIANLYKGRRRTTLLSDDRIIIRKKNAQFWIYGTPWHGDAGVASPEKILLKKIFFLNHAKGNKMIRINGIDAVSKLLICSFPTFYDKKGMEFTLGFIDEIISKVPCYILDFLPDKGIIDFIRDEFNV